MPTTNFPINLITDDENIQCYCCIPADSSMPFLTYEPDGPPSPHLNGLITPEDMLGILNAIKDNLRQSNSEGPLQ